MRYSPVSTLLRIRLFALAFLLPMAGNLAAQQYYVSPSGNDGNPGTLNLPWRTIQHALEEAVAGTNIFLMGGTYTENADVRVSGTPGSFITLTNYNGEHALLSCSNGAPLLRLHDVRYVRVMGLELGNCAGNDAKGILIDGACDHIEIRNNKLHDLHFSADANAPVMSTSAAYPVCIYGTSDSAATTSIVVSGNSIYNCRLGKAAAITVSGAVNGFTLSHNFIHDIAGNGIAVLSWNDIAASHQTDQPQYGTLRWNQCLRCADPLNSYAGIILDGAAFCTVENNDIAQNAFGLLVKCSSTLHTACDIAIRSNEISGNIVSGMMIGVPGNCQRLAMNNNTLVNNGDGAFPQVSLQNCTQSSFRNNILYADGASLLIGIYGTNTDLVVDNNLYFQSQGQPQFQSQSVYTSLSSWSAATGFDQHSLYTDPMFINVPGGNLHVYGSSPAIDAGDSLYFAQPGETDMDSMARVQNGRVDIGADEYGTAVGIPVLIVENGAKLILDAQTGTLDVLLAQPALRNSKLTLIASDGRVIATTQVSAGSTTAHFNLAQQPTGRYSVYGDPMKGSASVLWNRR